MSEHSIMAAVKRIQDTQLKENVANGMHSDSVVDTRANFMGITRTPTNIIYPEISCIKPTNSLTNTILAITYLDEDLNDVSLTPGDLSGAAGLIDEQEIAPALVNTLVEGSFFQDKGIIYKALKDDPTNGDTLTTVQECVFANTIRQYSDTGKSIDFELFRGSESRFIVSRWDQRVGTRKVYAGITKELVDDINAQGLDADGLLRDLMLTSSMEGINKDVIQKLLTISSKYKNKEMSESIVDLSALSSIVEAGRSLHFYATELAAAVETSTHYQATYIVGSSRAVSLLAASGWLKEYEPEEGEDTACVGTIAGGKLKVYKDTQSKFDYLVAGFVHDKDSSLESVGSLVVTPFTDGLFGISDVTVVRDPKSFNYYLQMMVRYGIGANPFTIKDNIEYEEVDGVKTDNVKGYYVKADDWEELAGKSLACWSVGLKLPYEVVE